MAPFATTPESSTAPADSVLSVLRSHEFRQAYHHAVDHASHTSAAQPITARSILEAYFGLEPIDPIAPLNPHAVYFTEHPVAVHGHYKFLVPGAVQRNLVPGPLFLLTPRDEVPAVVPSAELEPSIDASEFASAIAAVEAVRLTLIPERVNGIISFVSDAKNFYLRHDAAGAERAMGTALDHMNRAAADGLRRIQSDAERGKRSNELAGTRRRLLDLRTRLQEECLDRNRR